MQKINSGSELRDAILQLENKQDGEHKVLKQKFHLAYESLNPINVIRHTLKEAAESFDIKENLLVTTVGISVGFLAKKYITGNSSSPLRRLIATALVFGVTNFVATHPEMVKKIGRSALNFIGRIMGVRPHDALDDVP
jgi:hypothetical protein